MAIPGIPQNFNVQTANGQVLVSWALSTGAAFYQVQRSLDNVTYTSLAVVSGSPLATSYLDTSVSLATQYWYKVAASSDGVTYSPYTQPASAIPTPTAEMSLADIRLQAQQRADRVNSNFVTQTEWRNYINKAMYELYDLLITVYEDYYIAPPVQFIADGTSFQYALPNGFNTFLNGLNPSGPPITPPPFYKISGVDMALNNATNGYVTVNKFNFIDRNNFVYPNTSSTIYGVFNLQYRVMGSNLQFIPTPSAGQAMRIWYIPRLIELLNDTDTTNVSISGWIEYVIVRAAKYALDKEESDTTKLDQELIFLKGRIEETAANRDAGQPNTISNTRTPWGPGSTGYGPNQRGGWAIYPISLGFFPATKAYNVVDGLLHNSIFSGQLSFCILACLMLCAYLIYKNPGQLSRRVFFSRPRQQGRISNLISRLFNFFPESFHKKTLAQKSGGNK